MSMDDDDKRCINENEDCKGPVEFHGFGTGRAFPRCDHHWSARVQTEQEIRRKYDGPEPADFDPSYAGEHWGSEDY